MGDRQAIIRDILSRRDPKGYYVIVARKEAKNLVDIIDEAIIVDDAGDVLVVRTKSRSLAARIIRILAARGLLAF